MQQYPGQGPTQAQPAQYPSQQYPRYTQPMPPERPRFNQMLVIIVAILLVVAIFAIVFLWPKGDSVGVEEPKTAEVVLTEEQLLEQEAGFQYYVMNEQALDEIAKYNLASEGYSREESEEFVKVFKQLGEQYPDYSEEDTLQMVILDATSFETKLADTESYKLPLDYLEKPTVSSNIEILIPETVKEFEEQTEFDDVEELIGSSSETKHLFGAEYTLGKSAFLNLDLTGFVDQGIIDVSVDMIIYYPDGTIASELSKKEALVVKETGVSTVNKEVSIRIPFGFPEGKYIIEFAVHDNKKSERATLRYALDFKRALAIRNLFPFDMETLNQTGEVQIIQEDFQNTDTVFVYGEIGGVKESLGADDKIKFDVELKKFGVRVEQTQDFEVSGPVLNRDVLSFSFRLDLNESLLTDLYVIKVSALDQKNQETALEYLPIVIRGAE